MNMWPRKLFYIPYYALAQLVFFGHVASIHRIKMRAFVSAVAAEEQAFGILVVGAVLTALIIYRMSYLKMGPGRDVRER